MYLTKLPAERRGSMALAKQSAASLLGLNKGKMGGRYIWRA
jgi:hypothetical protein